MGRGDRREDIFVNDADRQDFLKSLAAVCQQRAWQAHACCLRNEITLPGKWIVARVQNGTAKGAKSVLHHLTRGHHPVKAARADDS